MPELTEQEVRIVGFLCNWCSYGGADTAGVARAKQPTDLRIIRVPCSGRVDPLFVVKALFNGADGVLVSGCHPRDCHYSAGNFYARRRLEVLKHFLPILGIDARRFAYTWVSASEGQRWQQVVTTFTQEIHALGRATPYSEVVPKTFALDTPKKPLGPVGPWNQELVQSLKNEIKSRLADLDLVLGWQEGRDSLHRIPLFIREEADLERLCADPLCGQNLATYLHEYRDKKIGLVVKACDVRSVSELVQEKLINWENVTLFTIPCEGTLDQGHIESTLGRYTTIERVSFEKDQLLIKVDGREERLPYSAYCQGKCQSCRKRLDESCHVVLGNAIEVAGEKELPRELALVESLSLEDRRSFWKAELERCLRCGACRNACPMCVCRDHCISDSRDPHFMTQEDTAKEKLFFQVVHALHLAGRCTECGECQRSCPMGIPILALRQKLNRIIAQLFQGYEAGTDREATPPLLGYAVEEQSIKEREWS